MRNYPGGSGLRREAAAWQVGDKSVSFQDDIPISAAPVFLPGTASAEFPLQDREFFRIATRSLLYELPCNQDSVEDTGY